VGIGAIAAIASAVTLNASTGSARVAPYVPSITFGSGTFLVFKGSTIQCLAFGPIASVAGKRGLFCFIGPPRTHKAHSYWAMVTPTKGIYDDVEKGVYVAITRHTRIKSTITVSSVGVTALHVKGTYIGCQYVLNKGIDPAGRVVICTDVDAQGRPYPKTYGFALSDHLFAAISFDAYRRLHVDGSYRHHR
jgi:hypothetical protein